MPDKQVTIVFDDSGGWMGVYIDGQLAREGESIEPGALLDTLGISYQRKVSALDRGQSLPRSLQDVISPRERAAQRLLEEADRLREQALREAAGDDEAARASERGR